MIDELTDEDRRQALKAALAELSSSQPAFLDGISATMGDTTPTNNINARNRADVDTRMASLGNGPPPMPRPNVSGFNSDRHDAAADAVAGLPPPNDYGTPTPAYPMPGMDPGELRGWSPTRAAPLKAPAQAAPVAKPQGPDDEVRAAGLADADTIERNGLSAAGRQLIAGLTRTAPVESAVSPADAVKQLYARRAQEKRDAIQGRYADNAAERNAANLETARLNMESAKTKAERDAALFEYNKLRNARTDERADKSLEVSTSAKQEELRLREEELARKKAEDEAKARRGGGGGGGSKLPVTQVAELADFATATKGLDELLGLHERSGMDGSDSMLGATGRRLESAVTPEGLNTATNEFKDKARATAQAVGTILEGGKLAAGDELKYARMMPQPGDSKERAAAKVANVKALLTETRNNRAKAFAETGYKVPASATATEAPSAPLPAGDMVMVDDGDGPHLVSARAAAALIKAGKAKAVQQ